MCDERGPVEPLFPLCYGYIEKLKPAEAAACGTAASDRFY